MKRPAPGGEPGRAETSLGNLKSTALSTKNPDGARWEVYRLDTTEARIRTVIDCPWFPDWLMGMALGKTACIHCGGNCRDTGLIGATPMDDERLLTITACRDCYVRSASFEAAARAAVDAADAGMVTSGRSFRHAVAGPETCQ